MRTLVQRAAWVPNEPILYLRLSRCVRSQRKKCRRSINLDAALQGGRAVIQAISFEDQRSISKVAFEADTS